MQIKQKSKLGFLILFLTISCLRVHYNETKIKEDFNLEKLNLGKIGIVGFYPIDYTYKRQGRLKTTTAILDYKTKEFQKLLTIGKPISEIPSTGIDSSIPEKKIREFIFEYLEKTPNNAGIKEIESLIEVSKIDSKPSFKFKKRNLDYYIVGTYGPYFQKNDPIVVSILLAIPTLYTFPHFDKYTNEITISIYDSKLNKINSTVINSSTMYYYAWWVFKPDVPAGKLFDFPVIKEINRIDFDEVKLFIENTISKK